MGDRLATKDAGRKRGAALPLSGEGTGSPILHNVASAEAYLRTKYYLDSSDRLATIHRRYRQTDRQTDNDSIERTVL